MRSAHAFRFAPLVAAALACVAGALDAGCSNDDTSPSSAPDASRDVAVEAAPALDGATPSDVATVDAADALANCGDPKATVPPELRCTGLYADPATKTVAAENRAYTPGLVFWSDGADKARWLYLPPGATIDTSDMDEWSFPIGTKAWKEFKIAGKRIETRFFWKRDDSGWVWTTYRWTDDESTATRLDDGAKVGAYEIPNSDGCVSCHNGRVDRLLGVEAIALALPTATGVTLATLKADGRLSAPPAYSTLSLPDDAPGKAAPALGWLHVNCGVTCHNGSTFAEAAYSKLFMRLSAKGYLADGGTPLVTQTDTYKTAAADGGVPIGDSGTYQSYRVAGYKRITPGDAAHSLVPALAASRVTDGGSRFQQMPPLVTHTVDDAGLDAVRAWIGVLK